MIFGYSLAQIIEPIALFFDTFGIFLVIFGGVIAVYEWVMVQVTHLENREKRKHQTQDLRVHFAQRLILGIEFFLAGDIMRLIATPTTDVLIRVGAIIVIRTILAYFLTLEIKELKERGAQ